MTTLLPDRIAGDSDEARRDALRALNAAHVAGGGAEPLVNGIDFVEVDPADHAHLTIHFLADVPPDPADPAQDVYGLVADPRRIVIGGGERIRGIRPVTVARVAPDRIDVVVDRAGDFSPYLLELTAAGLDPPLSRTVFSFMAPCASDVDCRHVPRCPPPPTEEPALDHLAKDYSSFRRLVLDLAAQRNPNVAEDNPADLLVTVAEMLAHTGDALSYLQDAVAGEAYLSTARRRTSIRRHARLVDYALGEGRNAWTDLVVEVDADGVLPAHTPVVTRLARPDGTGPYPTVIDPADPTDSFDYDTATSSFGDRGADRLAGSAVFETTTDTTCREANNRIEIHTFGRATAALPAGATSALLFTVDDATDQAARPPIEVGQLLALEEIRGVVDDGLAVDADRDHRVVVRVTGVEDDTDLVYARALARDADGEPALQVGAPADPRLPLLRVTWSPPLPFALCLAATNAHGRVLRGIAVARGNVARVDHGMRVAETITPIAGTHPVVAVLGRRPITVAAGAPSRRTSVRFDVDAPPADCLPDVDIVTTDATGQTETWIPVPDLFDSTPFDRHLVVEIEDDGFATARFGDGTYGADVAGATTFEARYRLGNGPDGNVSVDTLRHVLLAPAAGQPSIRSVRNPLQASHGTAPESAAEARIAAPVAFRESQERAVTAADYGDVVRALARVQDAAASIHWTGSWWTVFVAVDPLADADLVRTPDGRVDLVDDLRDEVLAVLERTRQAGVDLEVLPPLFVSLDVGVHVCAAPGHFRADIAAAVRDRLSNRRLDDGTTGFFHSANWTFGTKLWLSSLYTTVQSVPGVESCTVTRLRIQHSPDNSLLARGSVEVAPDQILRCNDDPSFPEHGVLEIVVDGGAT